MNVTREPVLRTVLLFGERESERERERTSVEQKQI